MRRPVGVKCSLFFRWTRFFSCRVAHCRYPSIRTLVERIFARCQLGVLVSAGAATCLSTSVSIYDGSWARRLTQSPELGVWAFALLVCFGSSFLRLLLTY